MSSLRGLLWMVALLAPALAAAQPTNNDYYLARGDRGLTELLATVEAYHLQPGIERMGKRDYTSAWNNWNFILSYFPNHPRVLALMGELCDTWRDPKCNMEMYLDKALQKSPNNEYVHLSKGVYLQKRGKVNEAIASYKKSLEINPSSANAHYNLALAYVEQKQYAQANEHAQQAYAGGMTLPGLRNKLMAAGAWKVVEPKSTSEVQAPAEGAARTKDGSN